LRQARLQEEAEAYWCPRVRLNVLVSDRDGEQLRRIAPNSRTATVPNGVDVQRIRHDREGGAGVVCVGGLGWFPNQDALEYLCEEIVPLLSATRPGQITWVGRATPEQVESYEARFGVRLTGYVDAVLPAVEAAACYVLPFRLGGGTRLKLLEALAAGRAIVSTTVGAMGVAVQHDRNLLIADTPAQFAGAVERVLADEALQRRLGAEARKLAESVYDWEAIGGKMTEIYGRIR
jgi:glycosyltransferase involved in cell wall biosynthesis